VLVHTSRPTTVATASTGQLESLAVLSGQLQEQLTSSTLLQVVVLQKVCRYLCTVS